MGEEYPEYLDMGKNFWNTLLPRPRYAAILESKNANNDQAENVNPVEDSSGNAEDGLECSRIHPGEDESQAVNEENSNRELLTRILESSELQLQLLKNEEFLKKMMQRKEIAEQKDGDEAANDDVAGEVSADVTGAEVAAPNKDPVVVDEAENNTENEENRATDNNVERVMTDQAVKSNSPQLENKPTQTQVEINEISTQTEVKSFETSTQTEVESREISTSTEAPQLETSCSQTDLKHFEIITPTKRISPAAHVKAAAVSVDSDAAVTSQPDSETGESSPARKRKKPALTTGFILNSSDEDSDAEDRRSRLDALCAQDSYEKQKK